MNEIMSKAIEMARETMYLNYGGPFGAAVVNQNGEILSVASNTVLKDKNPTAHAEINAIINACNKLGTHDLKGCILYTTAYPCPMCLSAIIWANIEKVYYGCEARKISEIGFRDEKIYDFIKSNMQNKTILDIEKLDEAECNELVDEYKEDNPIIY